MVKIQNQSSKGFSFLYLILIVLFILIAISIGFSFLKRSQKEPISPQKVKPTIAQKVTAPSKSEYIIDQLDLNCDIKETRQCYYKAPSLDFKAKQPIIRYFCWASLVLEDTDGTLHQFGKGHEKPFKHPDVKQENWHLALPSGDPKGDIRVWHNGFEQWNWLDTKTKHNPGIEREPLQDLINKPADVIILSQGVQRVLQTSSPKLTDYINELKKTKPHVNVYELTSEQEIKDYLKKPSIKGQLDIVKLPTFNAIILYNTLVTQGKKVTALIHTTC